MEAWRALLEGLNQGGEQGVPDRSGKIGVLRQEQFRPLSPSRGRVAYVDGGSAEILGAANFSLQRIRLAGVVLEGKRKLTKKEEFDVLVQWVDSRWVVSCFPANRFSGLSWGTEDGALKEGWAQVKPSRVAEVVRRLAELDFLKRFVESVKADLFVLDGSFEALTKEEEAELKEGQRIAISRSILCVGLSKTSRIVTTKGLDAGSVVKGWGGGAGWCFPVAEGDHFRTGLVKLHDKAKYVFRVDFWEGQKALRAVNVLAGESRDPVFLGYPYGLIAVDQLARICEEERMFLLLQGKAQAGKEWERLESCTRSLDAHRVLDRVR